MPRLDRRLTKDEVAKLSRTVGSHPVGESLYLLVRGAGKAYWVFRFFDPVRKRYSSQSFGLYSEVSLSEARRRREDANVARRNGGATETAEAPRNRPQAVAGKSFKEARDAYLDHNYRSGMWTAKSYERICTLLGYAAALDNIPCNQITTAQVADVLRPHWSGPANKGAKMRGHIEGVLTGNTGTDPNPATWDLLKHADHKLALKAPETQSHPSMPANEIPQFVRRLDMARVADRCVLFTILTGVRRKEAKGALWSEFDLPNKRWLVPGSRMKSRRDHFVPLSDAAIRCLGKPGAPDDFVFKGIRGNDALNLKKKFGVPYDLHGFRASLETWAEEQGYRTNVIKAVGAHGKEDDNGRALGKHDTAYMRATFYDDRRKLHDAWANHVTGITGSDA